ncbi:hypothetical protein [Mariprofundus sp. EBB-1]|nr:hypothetical protein [Mariprofundus sp. EBB-1]
MFEKISKEEKQSAESENNVTRVTHTFPRPLFSDKHQSPSPVMSIPA